MSVVVELKRTLLVRCATMLADESVFRHIGLNSESTLAVSYTHLTLPTKA